MQFFQVGLLLATVLRNSRNLGPCVSDRRPVCQWRMAGVSVTGGQCVSDGQPVCQWRAACVYTKAAKSEIRLINFPIHRFWCSDSDYVRFLQISWKVQNYDCPWVLSTLAGVSHMNGNNVVQVINTIMC